MSSEDRDSWRSVAIFLAAGVIVLLVLAEGVYLYLNRDDSSGPESPVLSVEPPEDRDSRSGWRQFAEDQQSLREQRVGEAGEVPLKVAEGQVNPELAFEDLPNPRPELDGEWVLLDGYIHYPFREDGSGETSHYATYLSERQYRNSSQREPSVTLDLIPLRGERAEGFDQGQEVTVLGQVVLQAELPEFASTLMASREGAVKTPSRQQEEWERLVSEGEWWKHVPLEADLAVREVYGAERGSREIVGGEQILEELEAEEISGWHFEPLDEGLVNFSILNSAALINGRPAVVYRYGNSEDSEVRYVSFNPESGSATSHTLVSGVNPSRLRLIELAGRPAVSFRDFNEERVHFAAARGPSPSNEADWNRHVITSDSSLRRPFLARVDGRPAMCALDTSVPGVVLFEAGRQIPRNSSDWSEPVQVIDSDDDADEFPRQNNPYCELTGFRDEPVVLASDISMPERSSLVAWRTEGEWTRTGLGSDQVSFVHGAERPHIFTRSTTSDVFYEDPVSWYRFTDGYEWERTGLTEDPESGPRFATLGDDDRPRFFFTTRADRSSENTTDVSSTLHFATAENTAPEGPEDWIRGEVDRGVESDSARRLIGGGLTAVIWNGRAVAFYDRCTWTRERQRRDREETGEDPANGWECELLAAVERDEN